MHRRPASLALAALLVLPLACTHHRPPTATLAEAAAQADKPDASARAKALGGFHAWLVESRADVAAQRFAAALEKDAADPYALYGQHLLARRAAAPTQALDLAQRLAVGAPRHPLSVPVARYALDQVGLSPALDDRLLEGARQALAAGAAGEAAQLWRTAQVAILQYRGARDEEAQVLAAMGSAGEATLLGPFSAQELLAWEEPTPPEKDGSVDGPFPGPWGEVKPRRLPAPDGRFGLYGEPDEGGVHLLAFDAEVSEEATYLLRAVGSSTLAVVVDGARVLERRAWARSLPSVGATAVRLGKGRHRLFLKVTDLERSSSVSLALARADGRPSTARLAPAQGPAPKGWGRGRPRQEAVPLVYPQAQELAAALAPEAGETLARFIAVRDALGRDREGAKRLLEPLAAEVQTPAVLALRAELLAIDRTVPTKVARGRATRDLEAALARDKGDRGAWLLRAQLALDDDQAQQALQALRSAREVQGSPEAGWPLPMTEARAQRARGVEPEAQAAAQAALALEPGLCEADELLYAYARRRDAVEAADRLVTTLAGCPGGLASQAEHARLRGKLDELVRLRAQALAREPSAPTRADDLADAYASRRDWAEATRVLEAARALWPRNTFLLKGLADLRERAGDTAGALALREQALGIEGADLTLRRQVVRARTGKEPLEADAVDGREALAAYEKNTGLEDTAAAYVLDSAVVEVQSDGSLLNRIHTVQKALQQQGVQEIAEVRLPAGAQVLRLRTLKTDGSVLEPEPIEGKETVSLPGVQVGDAVEVEYLLAEPARGPAMPGFTAGAFYFRIAGQPDHWVRYVVRAPKGTGLKVDAHHMDAPRVTTEGPQEVLRHDERRMPPFIPEPDAPPSSNELLPFVVVGAGTTGQEALLARLSDGLLTRGRLSHEVEAFARATVGDKKGRAAVQALYDAVMARIPGRDQSLGGAAAPTLAQERGSRLWLLKAALEAVDIPTRLVLVRPFSADPAPYLFPEDDLWGYAGLRADVKGEAPVWLDTSVRFGPFGLLPEQAAGGREAYLLAEPGRPLEAVKTPTQPAPPPKDVVLKARLGEDGALTGEGDEVYAGFSGAALGEAFQGLGADDRRQAVERSLARFFTGAELKDVRFSLPDKPGAPLTVHYAFRVPDFARAEQEEGRATLPPLTFPSSLGRRYVQLAQRTTPLLLDGSEASRTRVELTLAPGWSATRLEPRREVKGAYGSLVRTEAASGGVVRLEETLVVPMARIPPDQYEAFARWTQDVDQAQGRELFLVRTGVPPPTAARQ